MRRLLAAAAFVFLASLPACQCDERPDVGPIEGETSAVAAVPVGRA